MSRRIYTKTALTGGTATALDYIDGSALTDGDIALVFVSNRLYYFILDDDSAGTEDSPWIISPDSSAGNKRWVLQAPAVVTKETTGDPSYTTEGITVINTYDNTIKMYGDSGWRTLGTW